MVDTFGSSDSETNNLSKIFLNPKATLSDQIIYKVSANKLVPVTSVHQKINLTKEELLLLSFLVREYLGVFGSNWKMITMLILTDPNFSNKHLTTSEIQ